MKYYRIIFSALVVALFFLNSSIAAASATLGTIDPRNVGNFKALLENTSLAAPAQGITFGKFTTEASKNITVSSSELRGYGWGEGIGWFVVNCADTTSGCSSANNNFKVANDGTGKLSGYAWGENAGWINFGPFLNPLVSTVKITNGLFGGTLGDAGYAWSQNFGWIKFDCSSAASCVETDWRPNSSNGNGNSGTSGGGFPPDVCPNIPGVQSTLPTGKMLDSTGNCVDAPICPNITDYTPVPLAPTQTITTTLSGANRLAFAIQTFDQLNPAHPAGTFSTENLLNPQGSDQITVYKVGPNKYVLALEDIVGGDYDYQDLVVEVTLSCGTGGTCPTPDSLGDTTPNTINHSPGGEKDLQTILDDNHYGINKTTDQKQYQIWDIPPNTPVTISARIIGKYAAHSSVFGYYTDNTMATFVPILKSNAVGALPASTAPSLCIPNPIDMCPNISGNQTTMPPGKVLNILGQCVDIVPDACPNIAGSQLTVPNGMMYDAAGNCVNANPIDVCPNIRGNQQSLPSGMQYGPNGECIPSVAATQCAANPASCTPPPDACVTDPASCQPNKGICETNPAACFPPGQQQPSTPGGGNGSPGNTNGGTGSNTGTTPPPGTQCATNPSSCAPLPDVCQKNPQLCTPASTFCVSHPELCTPASTATPSQNPFQLLGTFINKIVNFLSPSGSVSSIPYSAFINQAVQLITALGVLLPVATTTISYALSNPFTWADIPLLLGRLWSSFLIAFGWKRRKKPWGVVYDSITKRPIDPAYVVLTDLFGNEIATAITDIDGRYGFAVDPGTYKITVGKSNYVFPSTKLAGKTSDSLYEDLYFGETITITHEGEIITKNIPIDQVAFDWNEYAKAQGNTHGQKLHFYRRLDAFMYRLSQILFVVGFAFSIYALFASATVWNAVILLLYIVLTVLRLTTRVFSAKGSVRSRADNEPLPFSIVRLKSTATNQEVAHKVADRLGNYYGLVHNGTYAIGIDTKVDEQNYAKHVIPTPVVVRKGYLKKNFKV